MSSHVASATVLRVCGAIRCVRLVRLRRIARFFRQREAELNARIIILRLFKVSDGNSRYLPTACTGCSKGGSFVVSHSRRSHSRCFGTNAEVYPCARATTI